jgi:hypothetical protein
MDLLWAKNSLGCSHPVAVNKTEAWWLQCSSTGAASGYVGDTVYVRGRNLGGVVITGATNTNPIVVTSANHGLTTGQTVAISGVRGNTAANGKFTATRLSAHTFSIPVGGNGVYVRGGIHSNKCWIYLQPSGSVGQWIAATSVNPYEVQFILPGSVNGVPVTAGNTYAIWLHNGHGGTFGWSEPVNLTVTTAAALGLNYAAHTYMMGAPSGGDDTAAFNKAIAAVTTPGTIVLRTGATYQLGSLPNPLNGGILLQGNNTTIKTKVAFNGSTLLRFDSKGAMDGVKIDTTGGGTFDGNLDHPIVAGGWRYTNCTFDTRNTLNRPIFFMSVFSGIVLRNVNTSSAEITFIACSNVIVDSCNFKVCQNTEFAVGGLSVSHFSLVNCTCRDLDPTQQWGPPISAPTMNDIVPVAGGALKLGTPYYWTVTSLAENAGETLTKFGPHGQILDKSMTPAGRNQTARISWKAVAGARGYKIYRSLIPGSQGSESYLKPALVATVGNVLTYDDTGTAVSNGGIPIQDLSSTAANMRGQGRLFYCQWIMNNCYLAFNQTLALGQADPGQGKGEQILLGEGSDIHFHGNATAGSASSVSMSAAAFAANTKNLTASGTDLACTNASTGAPVVTSGAYKFSAADIGSVIWIPSGTNWIVGAYTVTGNSGNGALLDRPCGSAANLTNGTWQEITAQYGQTLAIMGGKGVCQDRRVVHTTGSGTDIVFSTDLPWNVVPDSTSALVVIDGIRRVVCYQNTLQGTGLYVADNTVAEGGIRVDTGGIDVITDSNNISGLRWGIEERLTSDNTPGFFNLHQNNILNNVGANYMMSGNLNDGQSLSLAGTIFRNNQLTNIASYHFSPVISTVADMMVYENNTCSDAPIGINPRSDNVGACVLYNNVFNRGRAKFPGSKGISVIGSQPGIIVQVPATGQFVGFQY